MNKTSIVLLSNIAITISCICVPSLKHPLFGHRKKHEWFHSFESRANYQKEILPLSNEDVHLDCFSPAPFHGLWTSNCLAFTSAENVPLFIRACVCSRRFNTKAACASTMFNCVCRGTVKGVLPTAISVLVLSNHPTKKHITRCVCSTMFLR